MSRSADFLLVGLSHRTAPVAIRERVAVTESVLPDVLARLRALPGIEETFVVSTCNRVEVYASASESEPASRAIRAFLSASDPQVDGHLYEHRGTDAVRHLFRVCSSLDSMVLGEPQILGQVKDAFAAAEAAGTVRGLLARCAKRAFGVAKRVRTETGVGRSAVSMSFAAVDLARKILGTLEGRTVLLVGAGKMSVLAARHLNGAGCKRMLVVNRSQERAQGLAQEVGGEALPWEELPRALAQADVVVCSTAAPHAVITPALAQAARKARKHRPLFFVDLAVPRDVDPRVNDLDGIYVYDVDDLAAVVEENRKAREGEALKAEGLVATEADAFVTSARSEVGPVVRALRARAEDAARIEVERTLSRGEWTDAQRRSVEAMARALVNKILHEPTVRIRAAAAEEDGRIVAAANELFGLETGADPAPTRKAPAKKEQEARDDGGARPQQQAEALAAGESS